MTYDAVSNCIRPTLGGFYQLRAGLTAFVSQESFVHGVRFFKGELLPPGSGTVCWWSAGHYCTDRRYKHELDIVAELPY